MQVFPIEWGVDVSAVVGGAHASHAVSGSSQRLRVQRVLVPAPTRGVVRSQGGRHGGDMGPYAIPSQVRHAVRGTT